MVVFQSLSEVGGLTTHIQIILVHHLFFGHFAILVLVSVLSELFFLCLHPVRFVPLAPLIFRPQVTDVLIEIDQSISIFIDILQSLINDNPLHRVIIFRMKESSKLLSGQDAITTLVGFLETSLISTNHLLVLSVVRIIFLNESI